MRGILTILLTCTWITGCGNGKGGGEEDATDTADDLVDSSGDTGLDPPGEMTDPETDFPSDELTETEVECVVDGDCDDSDPCTADTCSPTGECEHSAVDADGDGHPAEEVEGTACGGTDCDDGNEHIHPGATTTCDLVDDDCSGEWWDEDDADDDGDYYLDDECGGDDCDDLRSDTYPGATEVCLDGFDQDCDGVTDGPMTMLTDVRLTTSVYSDTPDIVWTGSEFGICFEEGRDGNLEIYLSRLAPTGSIAASDIRLTTDVNRSMYCSLVWTGTGYGVSWEDERDGHPEIYLALLSALGVKTGSDIPVSVDTASSYSPSLVWTGSEYGLGWHDERDGNDEIYLARMSSSGSKQGSDIRVSSTTEESNWASVTWSGSEFGVGWNEGDLTLTDIYFQRISASGSSIGSNLRVTTMYYARRWPELAWTGSEFGIAWTDVRGIGVNVWYHRVAGDGSKLGAETPVTATTSESQHPALAWTGSGYGLVWEDDRDGNEEVYFALLTPAGTMIGSELRVTNALSFSVYPSIAWSGSEFGLTWRDSRSGDSEIYFTRIGMCE